MMDKYEQFYETVDRDRDYCISKRDQEVKWFIKTFNLEGKKCLEVGSGKGVLQYLIEDYTGLDVAGSLAKYYHKPYYQIKQNGTYPFPDNSFYAIWSVAVHEHIPDLNKALLELKRILQPDGVILFSPAWQCRPWVANGYSVRPYSDFGLKGKIIKALIPLRRSVVWRALFVLPKRIYRHLLFILGKRYHQILYRNLIPNYDVFWTSDSDACNSIDPHDAILWFESNGFKCLSHKMHFKAFLVRGGALIFRKTSA